MFTGEGISEYVSFPLYISTGVLHLTFSIVFVCNKICNVSRNRLAKYSECSYVGLFKELRYYFNSISEMYVNPVDRTESNNIEWTTS